MTKKLEDKDLNEVNGGRALHRSRAMNGGAVGRGAIANYTPPPVEDEPEVGGDNIPADTEGPAQGGNYNPF
jgi:hypothetical protein